MRLAARIALICGCTVVPLILWLGRGLLTLYVGTAAASDASLLYVRIRCLSLPAALVGGVLQASGGS